MKLPKYIQGAVFDLDGTLLDSLHVWQDVDRQFFAKRGLPLPEGYQDAIKSLDLYGAAVYTKSAYNLPEAPEELVTEWLEMVHEEYALRVALKPFAREYLEALHAAGIKLGVATSSARALFLPALERLGIAHLFTAFTETREAARDKRFPDPYLLAAERMGVSPANCAVYEDILTGVKSAKAGGFYAVAVADPFSAADERALKDTADLFVTSFEALL